MSRIDQVAASSGRSGAQATAPSTSDTALYLVKVQKVFVWLGVLFAVLFAIGFVGLAGFLPPLRPADSAAAITQVFIDRHARIELGMVVCQIGVILWVPWGVVLALRSRRIESGAPPVISYLQLGAVAVVAAQIEITLMFWSVAAFRPTETSPDTIRMLNDFAWFLFLFLFAPLTLWVATVVPLALRGGADREGMPKWLGWFSLVVAIALVPGATLPFFTTGPWAWDGAFPFYIPLVSFFAWLGAVSVTMYRSLSDEQKRLTGRP
jgi:hypothetical protein